MKAFVFRRTLLILLLTSKNAKGRIGKEVGRQGSCCYFDGCLKSVHCFSLNVSMDLGNKEEEEEKEEGVGFGPSNKLHFWGGVIMLFNSGTKVD